MISFPVYDSLLTVDRLSPVQAHGTNLSCCLSDISPLFPLPSSSYMFSLLFLNFRGSDINVLFSLSTQPTLNVDIWPAMNFCIRSHSWKKKFLWLRLRITFVYEYKDKYLEVIITSYQFSWTSVGHKTSSAIDFCLHLQCEAQIHSRTVGSQIQRESSWLSL